MKKLKHFLFLLLIVLCATPVFAKKPLKPIMSKELPIISASVENLDAYVAELEKQYTIKPDNESRIVWANDSIKEQTEYCLLYLHGYSASWYEGNPTHITFAQKFGMNAYLPRLASHGLETENALVDMTPDSLYDSSKEALVIAHKLGKKVILMSTSTGGTLSLKLAADFPDLVDGLILYSPNIAINMKGACLLSSPWGLKITRKVFGGIYREFPDAKDCDYWNCKYRLESAIYLKQLMDVTMTKETFKKVTVPTFVGYYYKDKKHQDPTVKVSAILKMFNQLGTSADKKVKVAFPDAGAHVIACEMKSGAVEQVIAETIKFGEEVLGLTPIAE